VSINQRDREDRLRREIQTSILDSLVVWRNYVASLTKTPSNRIEQLYEES
jgi:hypothetical protein